MSAISPLFTRVQSDNAERDIQSIRDVQDRFAHLQCDIEDMAGKRHHDCARDALSTLAADLDNFRHDYVSPLSMTVAELEEMIDG